MGEENKPAEEKTPKRGIGTVAKEAIRGGATNEEALEAVKKQFPDANTSLSSINWYRNKMRDDGEEGILSARELKKQRAAKAEGEKAAEKDPLE